MKYSSTMKEPQSPCSSPSPAQCPSLCGWSRGETGNNSQAKSTQRKSQREAVSKRQTRGSSICSKNSSSKSTTQKLIYGRESVNPSLRAPQGNEDQQNQGCTRLTKSRTPARLVRKVQDRERQTFRAMEIPTSTGLEELKGARGRKKKIAPLRFRYG